MNRNLVNQNHWDEEYKKFYFNKINLDNSIAKLIIKYFNNKKGTVFEAGCFPGNFLSVFGTLGYELNGLDKTPRTKTDLIKWLKDNNFKIGKIEVGDFTKITNNIKYDIVCSFGFIEHFDNTKEIILKHDIITKNGGYLIITTPNFSGYLQRKFHQFFDKENYLRHNIKSMNPYNWKKILEEANYNVIYCGWFGKIDFWVEEQKRSNVQKLLIKLILKMVRLLRILPLPNSKIYSPCCGIIAIKNIN